MVIGKDHVSVYCTHASRSDGFESLSQLVALADLAGWS